MKYFKKELWKYNNEENEIIWSNNAEKYAKYFESIKKYLPKRFLKVYLNEEGFHDYVINSINIDTSVKDRKNNLSRMRVELKSGQRDFTVELSGVSAFKIDISDKSYCICGKLSWGYAEFERIDAKKMKLSIICDIENELEFIFEKIRIL